METRVRVPDRLLKDYRKIVLFSFYINEVYMVMMGQRILGDQWIPYLLNLFLPLCCYNDI